VRVAVVGGGINGLSCAWRIAEAGHEVVLFERGEIMQATSRASSKLLHGGLRYLSNFEFRLVREALRERDAWLRRVPDIARPLSIVIPIYASGRNGRFTMGLGLFIYRMLAPRSPHSRYRWLAPHEIDAGLEHEGLEGGYEYFDGQSDDYQLGLWVLEQARAAGVEVHEHAEVTAATPAGEVHCAGETSSFDRVVNVAGPWAESLCRASGVTLPYELDLVRGSHIVLGRPCPQAYLLEVRDEERLFFVLPWHGETLVGTTEVRQTIDQPIEPAPEEIDYLLRAFNHAMCVPAEHGDIVDAFAGVRPLIKSANNPTKASREYAVHRSGKLVTVLGGKWTTALALARTVLRRIQ
jgi:glycerol-3-phosphate dehydrogenase